jgi:Transposase
VKKVPAQKSRYLGQVVDKERMEFIKPGNVTMNHEKLILDFGDAYSLIRFMENRMKDVYDFALKNGILPLILYRILGKTSMRRGKQWYEDSITRYLSPGDMHSQRISELLAQIGEESVLRDFYKIYLKQPEDGISIDTTALPNQIDMDMTQWGYSSETMDEEIKLILVMDREKNRPLYFRYVPGSIMDVSVLSTTNSEMEKLGIKPGLSIMDAGFFSENNVRSMMEKNIDFMVRVPANRNIYHDLVGSAQDMENPEKAVRYGNRIMFITSSSTQFADHMVCTYLILDPERRGRELRRYMLKHLDDYDPFTVKRKGFMVLMSSQSAEVDQLIPLYYTRQFVEKVYSYSKDDLSLLPLRLHGEKTLRGYLFIIFLSLIVYMSVQKEIASVEMAFDSLLSFTLLVSHC